VKKLWIIVLVVAALLGAAFALSEYARRYAVALVIGLDAAAYRGPRVEVQLQPGPTQPRVAPADVGIDPNAIAAAVAYAEPRNTRALVVGHSGHIVFEKYWDDSSLDTQVDLSGFTPVLAALLVGTAQVDRRIASVAEPISNYIEGWRPDDGLPHDTLRSLLALTARLEPARGWPLPHSRAARVAIGTDIESLATNWPRAEPSAFAAEQPGIEPQLLALILSRRSKQPYQALLARDLWIPIEAGTFSMSLDRKGGVVRAATGLRARIGDWMRIGEVLANDGVYAGNQLTPPGWVRRMMTATVAASRFENFVVKEGDFAARDVARLEAEGKQRLWIVPSLRLVILRLGDDPPGEFGWDERLIPDSIIRGTRGWEAAKGKGTDPSQFAPH
jgi:CubicO group peptidase (beta-lactamase class C family)